MASGFARAAAQASSASLERPRATSASICPIAAARADGPDVGARELLAGAGGVAREQRLPALLDGRVEGARQPLAGIEREMVARGRRGRARAPVRQKSGERRRGERDPALRAGSAGSRPDQAPGGLLSERIDAIACL